MGSAHPSALGQEFQEATGFLSVM